VDIPGISWADKAWVRPGARQSIAATLATVKVFFIDWFL
jgi:hypothetical protein